LEKAKIDRGGAGEELEKSGGCSSAPVESRRSEGVVRIRGNGAEWQNSRIAKWQNRDSRIARWQKKQKRKK